MNPTRRRLLLAGAAARHADPLADAPVDAPADPERIRAQQAEIGFLDDDWALNDTR